MDTKRFKIAHKKLDSISSLGFNPDRACFVALDSYGTLCQWSTAGGVQTTSVWTTNIGSYPGVTAVSPDGQWIVASRSEISKVTIWNSVTREHMIAVTGHTQVISALDISDDLTRFASGSADRTVRIFDITSGTRLIPPLLQGGDVVGLKFSSDTSQIVTSARYSSIGVYSTSSGDQLFIFPMGSLGPQPTISLAWSSDDKQIFFAYPGKITCFDTYTRTGSEWLIHASSSEQPSMKISGKFVACTTGSSLSIWDPASRKQMGQTINHTMKINCFTISHDGRRLACGDNYGITIYNLEEIIPEHYFPAIPLPLVRVSVKTLKAWVQGNPTEAEAILSDEIAQYSNPTRDMLAIYAFLWTHLGQEKKALEAAEMSLKIKSSPIGQVARSVALIRAGEHEVALDEIDLLFRDCRSDENDIKLLSVISSILLFVCNKRQQAISRLRYFIDTSGNRMKDTYLQVLGMMYLKQRDYGNAVQTLGAVENPFTPEDRGPLMTLYIIFNWNFEDLKLIAWQRACERLYVSGSMEEVRDTLLKMIGTLPEEEMELAHGRVLQEIINRSGEVTLLAWTGKSSACHSCLPSSPAVYAPTQLTLPTLEGEQLEKRIAELRTSLPLVDALLTYCSVTRSQPVRFTSFHLHLPCIVFRLKALRKEHENIYHAETVGLGSVQFTTADLLPLNEPRKLVFINPWIDHFRESREVRDDEGQESDVALNPHVRGCADVSSDVELVHEPMIEEAPTPRNLDTDVHTRALRLIACLERPFSALLLLKQPGGAYKRVAADHEIIVRENEEQVLKDIRVEVLEVI